MQRKVIKVIQAMVVAASMVAGFMFYQRFSPEGFMMKEGAVVSMADIHADPTGNHAGKAAGEDIPRLTGREELGQLIVGDYAAITTKEIMATNVYSLKPWVDPYSLTKIRLSSGRTASTGRRASEATKGSGVRAEANHFTLFLIRFGAAVGVFFVLAVGLFLLLGKVFPMEDEWGR